MRSFWRAAFLATSIGSALVGLAIATVWVRRTATATYRLYIYQNPRSEEVTFGALVTPAWLEVVWQQPIHSLPAPAGQKFHSGSQQWYPGRNVESNPSTPERVSFRFRLNMKRQDADHVILTVVTGYPWLFLASSVFPVIAIWRSKRRRPNTGPQCHICGYDIRATPHRCPECGAELALKR